MGLLRFVLALAVIIAHSTPIFGLYLGGGIAVPCFFVISGFYMTLILSEKYVGSQSSYWLYLSNRLLRLYPVYFVVLLITLVANIYAYMHGGSPKLTLLFKMINEGTFPISAMVLYLFSSITFLFQDLIANIGIKDGSMYLIRGGVEIVAIRLGYFNLVPQGWSLGSEILFYIIAPIIVKQKKIIISILIAVCIVFRIYVYKMWNLDLYNQTFFPSVLPYFLLGTFSYRIYKNEDFNPSRLLQVLALILFLAILNFYQFIAANALINLIYPVVFACLVPFIFILTKNSMIDRNIGELSYPMYIVHLLISMILSVMLPNPIFRTGIAIGSITILASFILIKIVVDPIERLRRNRVKNASSVIENNLALN